MAITYIDIKEGDTVASIAKRHGMSIAQVIRDHNRLALPGKQIIDFKIPPQLTQLQLMDLFAPLTQEEEESFYLEHVINPNFPFDTVAKYRCEQMVMTKINGVIRNHAETKREFEVKKQFLRRDWYIRVLLHDNIVKIYPESISEAVGLLSEIDGVKCDFICKINPQTGMIEEILDHQKLIARWDHLKNSFIERYAFLRSPQIQQKFDEFIGIAESQITDQSLLIQDLRTKMFFDLFFDTYLVQDIVDGSRYSRKFYSQLFEGIPVNLEFEQKVLSESPDTVTIEKTGVIQQSKLDEKKLESLYDEKFKPTIHYKFSEYNYSYRENCIIDTKKQLINYADVLIKEEVKNNIEIVTDYKLFKIE